MLITRYTDLAVILLATTFFSRATLSQKYEGDECRDNNGKVGVCKLVDTCDEAKKNLDNGILPEICGFHKQTPIVCCPSSTPVTPDRQSTGKSQQKCLEYANLVYVDDGAAPLLLDSEDSKTNQCVEGSELIIGGTKALPKEFPHMAAVGYGEENDISWWCGGSLISERFVVTAAHCLSSRGKGLARWVRLGDLNLVRTDDKVETQQFGIERLFRHPDYIPPARYNDIGLMKLNRDVTFSAFVRPACIHTDPKVPNAQPEAIGWGLLEWGASQTSDDLYKVGLNYIDMQYCNKTYAPLEGGKRLNRGIDERTMLCVGDLKGGKDTCQGDSGGPLHVHMEKPYCMFNIIGITSFGSFCGNENSPAIYTKISSFIPWIESIVWP